MKNRIHSSLVKYGVAASLLVLPLAARATTDDPIAGAITSMSGLADSVGGGAATVVAIAMVFVGIKLARRLLGKV